MASKRAFLYKAIKRNTARFPEDFMFQLSKEEFDDWRSQIVISNPGTKKGLRYAPYAFTEVKHREAFITSLPTPGCSSPLRSNAVCGNTSPLEPNKKGVGLSQLLTDVLKHDIEINEALK